MNPRYLYLVDSELQPVKSNVRVGLAVETVGQAGRPKTITGFQVIFNLRCIGLFDSSELDTYIASSTGIQRSSRIGWQ